jgi:glycosyltransferase involved in cell wall biosynthesis
MLAKHLDRALIDFHLCVLETISVGCRQELEATGCTVYELGQSRRFYNVVQLLQIVYRVYGLCRVLRPDIVQTHALHANLLARPAAKWAGVRTLVSTENCLPDIEQNSIRRVLNAPLHGLNRLWDRMTQRIVVVSERLRRWKDPSGTSQRIRVIPPPFALDAWTQAQVGRRSHRPLENPRAPVLGVVGRLSREKGHRYLIDAMSAILVQAPEAQLRIVGAGPLEAELRSQVSRLGLSEHVTFVGYTREVYAEYAGMDLLVVPSLSDAFPIVILEGMMMGLPIVGTWVGGIPELVVDGDTGRLVPPRDAAALAGACGDLLKCPEIGRRLGQHGHQRVRDDFNPSRFVMGHQQLYTEVSATDLKAAS